MIRVDLKSLINAQPVSGAWLSDCGLYRYALWRVWDASLPLLVVCMLNPSTADGLANDPTIRRNIAFTKRDGFGGILVVNLCAFRSTDPANLKTAGDAFGPLNEFAVYQAAQIGGTVLVAWGAAKINPMFVLERFRSAGARVVCLGKTKDGHPRHPLYVRGDQPMVEFGP